MLKVCSYVEDWINAWSTDLIESFSSDDYNLGDNLQVINQATVAGS